MNLPAFCIHRPAFTIVISLMMIIMGLIGFIHLPIRFIPNVSVPALTISTAYPGANAYLVDENITKVIEESLSGITGIDVLTSRSTSGLSQVSLTFSFGRNMDAAVSDVRSSLERIRGDLPKEADTPVVLKDNLEDSAILYLSFFDAQYSERELSDYVSKFIIPAFETIDGVGSVDIFGERLSAMKIALDPLKMASANVTVDEVIRLLQAQNASLPGGEIRSPDRFYSVITNTGLKSVSQFNHLIIRDNFNQPVRLKDIGEASIDAENTDSSFRVSGKPAIALGIIPESIANPLAVERQIQRVLATLKKTLPQGMSVSVDFNIIDYIKASMHSVYEAFFESLLFVWLVIFAFLGNFRATLIPIVTIPVCLISTFALLYLLGFTINTITLMAFVLAIGLVVDDAIVIVENISRHMERGMSVFKAALLGSQEMIFPIIAMTLTLAAVYLPIALTQGMLGALFREFTFTLAGAVIISGIIAITLSPMMCARILKPPSANQRYRAWFNQQLLFLRDYYQKLLQLCLLKRSLLVWFLLVVSSIGVGIFYLLPSELAPAEDMNEFYAYIAAPRNASFQYTDSYVRKLESILAKTPDIVSYLSIVGMHSPSHSYQLIKLRPKNERERTSAQVMDNLMSAANFISGVRFNVANPQSPLAEFAGSDSGDHIGLVIMTTDDYRKLQQVVTTIMDDIKQVPGFTHVDNKFKWDSEQFEVDIDRERAADLGISIPDVTNTISTLLASKVVGKTENNANIIVQLNKNALADPNVFQQLYVRNQQGNMLPLSRVVTIKENSTPQVYYHYGKLRADTIYVSLAANFSLAQAINTLQVIAKKNLPDNMNYTFTGEAKTFLDSNNKTTFTFMLALIFIYLVLVAQFESFVDPLIILLTVPFAMVGALFTLKIFGGSLNVYSNIGLITLVGLIAKHGILITEFANCLRRQGKSIQEAVLQASLMRLRPILMTTSAMVLGALPLALAFGPGSESRVQIGLVITGGLLFGTIFSLIVVPITYSYLAQFRKITILPTT